jgi:hypothetical protein
MTEPYKTELHGVPVEVLPLPNEKGIVKAVIQKRLGYAHEMLGIKPEDGITFDDSAYARIEEISGGNPKYALRIFEYVCKMAQKRREHVPFTVTADHVDQTGFTREMFERAPDMAFDVNVIYTTPWWQK